jgi:AbiV family abortive infection protein
MSLEHKTSPTDLSPAIRASLENGDRLLEDGQNLLEYGRFPTAYALFILAQEEYAKAFLLHLVQAGAIPWNSDVCQALRNHTCKQLLATIMEYLNSEWEEYLTTLKLKMTPQFPPHVADALNIIRHEKVPKQSASAWLWDGETPCDRQARRIADGSMDKQKQNALYVDVAGTGQVSSTPLRVKEEEATTEFEKTKRLGKILFRLDGNIEVLKTVEYEKVFDTFKVLFGLTTVEEHNKRW